MSRPDLTRARWRKSSRSNANQACVEVAFVSAEAWRKSSRSNPTQDCVEVAVLTDLTAVRDSKNPAGGALVLGSAGWHAFRYAIRSGGFDTPGA